MEKFSDTPSHGEVSVAQDVLYWLQCEVADGSFDGWGLDLNTIICVEGFLANLKRGTYGDRLNK